MRTAVYSIQVTPWGHTVHGPVLEITVRDQEVHSTRTSQSIRNNSVTRLAKCKLQLRLHLSLKKPCQPSCEGAEGVQCWNAGSHVGDQSWVPGSACLCWVCTCTHEPGWLGRPREGVQCETLPRVLLSFSQKEVNFKKTKQKNNNPKNLANKCYRSSNKDPQIIL